MRSVILTVYVQVHGPFVSFFHVLSRFPHRVVGSPPGTKPKAGFRKLRVENGRQYLQESLLDQAVHYGRYP